MTTDLKLLVTLALLLIVLWLGRTVHQRSLARQRIYGGGVAAFFHFLCGLCFVAILPTVCASVLFLHPQLVDIAGVAVNPLVLIVVGLALLSLLASFAFALVERAPAAQAERDEAQRESQGWTERDARRSGL